MSSHTNMSCLRTNRTNPNESRKAPNFISLKLCDMGFSLVLMTTVNTVGKGMIIDQLTII